eukprot:CAMPEP_0194043202 /NCGR_PEP_ID=MMETSP0009_2-20130614/14872_1 /TAXON_ID=210454 /ORGANISM="Grammatophora oceanica, Strain CCMP 410" /LENGTH=170 /DNA_ID=CAMNT_0038687331 /DNA_START=834 /DNA_END=1346 /DNA_ORIENTATION=+
MGLVTPCRHASRNQYTGENDKEYRNHSQSGERREEEGVGELIELIGLIVDKMITGLTVIACEARKSKANTKRNDNKWTRIKIDHKYTEPTRLQRDISKTRALDVTDPIHRYMRVLDIDPIGSGATPRMVGLRTCFQQSDARIPYAPQDRTSTARQDFRTLHITMVIIPGI